MALNRLREGLRWMEFIVYQTFEIERKTIELLSDWNPIIHTITSDNGNEFADHKSIAQQLNIDFYFVNPYLSRVRGQMKI